MLSHRNGSDHVVSKGQIVSRLDAGAADQIVQLAIAGPIATLTLNRPNKLNALTAQMFRQIRAHINSMIASDTVSCLIVAGAGRSFCAGRDLEEAGEGDTADHIFNAETIDLLERFPHPTIAKIQGYCLTGGLELALACDILVCSDDAKLGDTHGKWGLVPVWGMSVRLPERVGIAIAKELTYTGRLIDGEEAARIRLVNHCVPAASLDDSVARVAGEIIVNSRGSNQMNKDLYGWSVHEGRQRHLAYERSRPHGFPSDSQQRMQQQPRPKETR